jgi:hypothetical protein
MSAAARSAFLIEVLTSSKSPRHEDPKIIKSLWQKAKSLGLKGDAQMQWVLEQRGWNLANDESKVKRFLRLK